MESYLDSKKQHDKAAPLAIEKSNQYCADLSQGLKAIQSKNLSNNLKIQAVLQLIHSIVLQIKDIHSLKNVYDFINHDTQFIFLKTNPFSFHHKGRPSPASSKLAGVFLHHCKNWLLRQLDPQSTEQKILSQHVISSSKEESNGDFQTALQLLNSLKPALSKKDGNRQLFQLMQTTLNELISDSKFAFACNRFMHQELKNFYLGLSLQNLASMFDYSYDSDIIDPMRYYLLAVTFYKLNNPDDDISAEAKLSGAVHIHRCIKKASSVNDLTLLLEYLSKDGFNFLRQHKNPNLTKLQNAFLDCEKQTDTWRDILNAVYQRANEIQPGLSKAQLDDIFSSCKQATYKLR